MSTVTADVTTEAKTTETVEAAEQLPPPFGDMTLDQMLRELFKQIPAEFHATVTTQLTAYAMAQTAEQREELKKDVIHFTMVEARKYNWCETAEVLLSRIFPEETRGDGEWYDRDGFNRYDLTEDGYKRDGFHRNTGLDRDGYDKRGLHHETRLDRDGYDRHGVHHETGLTKEGYDREGYHFETGFNKAGYNREGLDVNGRDREGYDENGVNEDGLSKYRFDANGYDPEGYDRNGWNDDGFNRKGINRHTGRDKNGFDENGQDQYGFNRETGLNKHGQTRFTFGPDGYDADGYDYRNQDRDGYNREENARRGRTPRMYSN